MIEMRKRMDRKEHKRWKYLPSLLQSAYRLRPRLAILEVARGARTSQTSISLLSPAIQNWFESVGFQHTLVGVSLRPMLWTTLRDSPLDVRAATFTDLSKVPKAKYVPKPFHFTSVIADVASLQLSKNFGSIILLKEKLAPSSDNLKWYSALSCLLREGVYISLLQLLKL